MAKGHVILGHPLYDIPMYLKAYVYLSAIKLHSIITCGLHLTCIVP